VSAIDGSSFELQFETPVRAVAPGQAAVLYRGGEVVGGGTIEPAASLTTDPAIASAATADRV
jgi:tRNA-specific 2-thiouridylase